MSPHQSCASRFLLSLVAVSLLTPAVASAQATPTPPAKACDVDYDKPGEVLSAYTMLQFSASQTDPVKKRGQLVNVIKKASEKAEAGANLVGRASIIGQSLVYIMADTAMPLVTTRGAVGLTGNPAEPVDLIVTVDSVLRVVETAHPECAEAYQAFRQNQGWLTLLNLAQGQMTKGDMASLDSAEKLILRSMIMNKKSPYSHQFLATIWQQRSNRAKAVEEWRKVIDVAGTDTSNNEIKRQGYYYLASLLVEDASGDTNKTRAATNAREAAKLYKIYIDGNPKDPEIATVRYNLGVAYMVAGDTNQIPSVYAEVLAKPDSFTTADLFEAGRLAAGINKTSDAAALFGGAAKKDPYNRAALYNAAAMLVVDQKFDAVLALATRLLEIDPSNGDNYEILEAYYSGVSSKETDQAKKKAAADSLLKYNMLKDSLPVKVEVDKFSKTDGTVGGIVHNKTKAARTFEITFELVNAQNAVIATQAVTVAMPDGKPIEPGQATGFSAKLTIPAGAAVAGYRYKPVK